MVAEVKKINEISSGVGIIAAAEAAGLDTHWIIENLPVGIFVLQLLDDNAICLHLNTSFAKMFGVDQKECPNAPINKIHKFPSANLIYRQSLKALEANAPQTFEWQYNSKPNERYLSCNLMPQHGLKGQKTVLGVVTDRTSEKKAELSLLHNALHDHLTDLPNRQMLQYSIAEFLEERRKFDNSRQCAVIIINVDRFQHINETLGHVAGDEFLKTLTRRFQKVLNEGDMLSRINGDEFTILMRDIENSDQVSAVTEQIHDTMNDSFSINDTEFYATVSIGFSSTFSSQPFAEEVIRDGDFAMHRAKKSGRGQTASYHRGKHQYAQSRFQMEVELRRALRDNELELHYQPIIDLRSGKLTAFEALCRWRHPEKGLIPPNDFIPLAEETGIIIELGRWALQETCEQLKDWRSRVPGANDLYIAVNVSGVQFSKVDVAHQTAVALARSGVPGHALRIELTESTLMTNPEETAKSLQQLKDLDVSLALDDFGTGYSSLSYLQQFPLDVIKIDQSFVFDIETNAGNKKIVEIISMLSQTLGFSVVAEGIENPNQIKILQKLKCQYAQGYHFSKPVEKHFAEELILKSTSWIN
jgi:diguanylate cyclase (GGDEF)-like protein/PAS domain S-box-containing protein